MDDLCRIIESVKTYLETEKLAGMGELFVRRAQGPGPRGQGGEGKIEEYRGDKKELLEKLKGRAEECRGCALYKRRTNLVFGVGTRNARLLLIGEAPGADEDLKGEPFVGRAGELLTKIIEAIGLKRADVYIANILKCRPPNNRPPEPDEISACSPFLIEQIKAINPKIICTLGKFASQFILKSEQPISALRGKFYDLDIAGINGVKVMPTFHPAYLLRNPNDKKLVWEDFKKIREALRD